MRKITALALALLVVTACTALPALAGNVLRVAVAEQPPFFFLMQGEPAGVVPDILAELGASLQYEIEYVPCAPGQVADLLRRGDADLAAGVLDRPENAAKMLLIRPPYAERPETAFYRLPQSKPVTKYLQVRGRKLGVCKGADLGSGLASDKLVPRIEAPGAAKLFKLLLAGQVDLVALDRAEAEYTLRAMGMTHRVERCVYAQPGGEGMHFAFSLRSRQLGRAGEFESGLGGLADSGMLRAIVERHLKPEGKEQ